MSENCIIKAQQVSLTQLIWSGIQTAYQIGGVRDHVKLSANQLPREAFVFKMKKIHESEVWVTYYRFTRTANIARERNRAKMLWEKHFLQEFPGSLKSCIVSRLYKFMQWPVCWLSAQRLQYLHIQNYCFAHLLASSKFFLCGQRMWDFTAVLKNLKKKKEKKSNNCFFLVIFLAWKPYYLK